MGHVSGMGWDTRAVGDGLKRDAGTPFWPMKTQTPASARRLPIANEYLDETDERIDHGFTA
jgi:hypothetical protein